MVPRAAAVPVALARVALAAVALSIGLPAQGPARDDATRRARALAARLELPASRTETLAALLPLGAPAARALAERLSDPRPELVEVFAGALRALGPVARAATPQLTAMATGDDAAKAYIAQLVLLDLERRGVTWVAEYAGGRVLRIDADGAEHEVAALRSPWDVDLLPDGHVLITQYVGSRVIELDAAGKQVWSYEALKSPLEADRLLDGNTLIADAHGKRVVEVDRAGAVAWEWPLPARLQGSFPYDVERLADGRTLVALFPGAVVEVDRAGEVVWELADLPGPFDADRLPSGNTLVALYSGNAVREYDRAGEVVWQREGIVHPNDADRLEDGSTMVSTEAGIVVVPVGDGEPTHLLSGRGRVAKFVRR